MASRREYFDQDLARVWQAISDLSGADRRDLLEVRQLSDGEWVQVDEYRRKTHYRILAQEGQHFFQVEIQGKKTHQIFSARLEDQGDRVQVDLDLKDLKDGGFRPAFFSAFFVDSDKLLARYAYELRARLER